MNHMNKWLLSHRYNQKLKKRRQDDGDDGGGDNGTPLVTYDELYTHSSLATPIVTGGGITGVSYSSNSLFSDNRPITYVQNNDLKNIDIDGSTGETATISVSYDVINDFLYPHDGTGKVLHIILDGRLYHWDSGLQQIGSDTNWSRVEGDRGSYVGLKSDGTIWSWGSNAFGTTGQGTTEGTTASPTQIGSDTDWVEISVGWEGALALKDNGDLYWWGDVNSGAWGPQTTPAQIAGSWKHINASGAGFAIINTAGQLWVVGTNWEGALGLNNGFNDVAVLTQVGSDTDWEFVNTTHYASTAIKGGQLYGTGFGNSAVPGQGSDWTDGWTLINSDTDWKAVFRSGGTGGAANQTFAALK